MRATRPVWQVLAQPLEHAARFIPAGVHTSLLDAGLTTGGDMLLVDLPGRADLTNVDLQDPLLLQVRGGSQRVIRLGVPWLPTRRRGPREFQRIGSRRVSANYWLPAEREDPLLRLHKGGMLRQEV